MLFRRRLPLFTGRLPLYDSDLPLTLLALLKELAEPLDFLFLILEVFGVIDHGLVNHLFELKDLGPHGVLRLPAFLQLLLQNCLFSCCFVEKSGDFAHALVQVAECVLLEEELQLLNSKQLAFQGSEEGGRRLLRDYELRR